MYTATYSPDDNKLRLYATARLDADLYARAKAAGFRWAPKQECFYTTWSPGAEDLAEELAGSIDDDDKTLTDRAEERAERFDEYHEKRTAEATAAAAAVDRISEHIPLGQPILIGHHSERHARRDAQKIENNMRRAVNAWKTAEYWTSRAAGAIAHAKYKERPDVRARRIKGLESDLRKQEKYKASAERSLRLWNAIDTPEQFKAKADGTRHPREELAQYCANVASFGARLNTTTDASRSYWSAWDVLRPDEERYKACPAMTIEEVQEAARRAFPATIAHCQRWIDHFTHRLEYERAMLEESGGTVADRTKPEKGGAVQCWAGPRGGFAYIQRVNKATVTIHFTYNEGGRVLRQLVPFDKLVRVLSAADVSAARAAGHLTETTCKTGFYLHESKPDPTPPAPARAPATDPAADFRAMEQTLKAGVQVVSVPQLFPTPRELAERVADLADIQPGMRVLEPSAGTGAILGALGGRMFGHNPERGSVHACEINPELARHLQREFPLTAVRCVDFLETVDEAGFDRIVMNPPFANGADIAHILHAREMLKPGGRLIAICANGPRQQKALRPLAAHWESLPADTFKEQGTGVNTALLILEQPTAEAQLEETRANNYANACIKADQLERHTGTTAGDYDLFGRVLRPGT